MTGTIGIKIKEQMMDNDEVLLLGSGFCGLSGKKQAIILGMAKALVFTQAERGQTAKAPLNALTGARRRSVGGKTTHTRQRVPAL